jgi:hypothetical protein
MSLSLSPCMCVGMGDKGERKEGMFFIIELVN